MEAILKDIHEDIEKFKKHLLKTDQIIDMWGVQDQVKNQVSYSCNVCTTFK